MKWSTCSSSPNPFIVNLSNPPSWREKSCTMRPLPISYSHPLSFAQFTQGKLNLRWTLTQSLNQADNLVQKQLDTYTHNFGHHKMKLTGAARSSTSEENTLAWRGWGWTWPSEPITWHVLWPVPLRPCEISITVK